MGETERVLVNGTVYIIKFIHRNYKNVYENINYQSWAMGQVTFKQNFMKIH